MINNTNYEAGNCFSQIVTDISEKASPHLSLIITTILPHHSFESWKVDSNGVFEMTLNKSYLATYNKIDVSIEKIVKGKLVSNKIEFDKGCIRAKYLVTGSLTSLSNDPTTDTVLSEVRVPLFTKSHRTPFQEIMSMSEDLGMLMAEYKSEEK